MIELAIELTKINAAQPTVTIPKAATAVAAKAAMPSLSQGLFNTKKV